MFQVNTVNLLGHEAAFKLYAHGIEQELCGLDPYGNRKQLHSNVARIACILQIHTIVKCIRFDSHDQIFESFFAPFGMV